MTTMTTVDSATLTSQNIGAGLVEVFSQTLAGDDPISAIAAIRISGRGAATTVDLRLKVLVGGILLADNVVEYLGTATTSLEIQTIPFVWRNGETLQIYLSSSSAADSSVGVATVVSTEQTAASVDTAAIATASAAAILATPANKLVTNPSGQVSASNLVTPPTESAIATAVVERAVSDALPSGSLGRIVHSLSTLIEFISGGWRFTAKALELIKAKTDLITSAGVTIVGPVRQDGTLHDLVVGDAYQAAAGRAITITVTGVDAGLQTILTDPGATVHLGFLRYGKSRQNPDFRRYEFPGTIVSIGSDTVVQFELTTDDTRGIVPSKYDYDVEFRQNANFVTAVSNAKGRPMEWVESATELS